MHGLKFIFVFLFLSLLLMQPATRKSLNYKINHKKKNGPTKYSQEKFWTHEYARENFGPMKYLQEKILDPQSNHKKNSRSTKYPQEKILDPQNTHEGTMSRWH